MGNEEDDVAVALAAAVDRIVVGASNLHQPLGNWDWRMTAARLVGSWTGVETEEPFEADNRWERVERFATAGLRILMSSWVLAVAVGVAAVVPHHLRVTLLHHCLSAWRAEFASQTVWKSQAVAGSVWTKSH